MSDNIEPGHVKVRYESGGDRSVSFDFLGIYVCFEWGASNPDSLRSVNEEYYFLTRKVKHKHVIYSD